MKTKKAEHRLHGFGGDPPLKHKSLRPPLRRAQHQRAPAAISAGPVAIHDFPTSTKRVSVDLQLVECGRLFDALFASLYKFRMVTHYYFA
jgi:hypothetical protein